jgi:acetylornithine deacetylase/succinyl-diaminopimelate desuccinylase-like protein
LLTGTSDARHFARLGIQTYGFLPLRLPKGFTPIGLVHGADERVPVDALEFGTQAILRALQRFGEPAGDRT